MNLFRRLFTQEKADEPSPATEPPVGAPPNADAAALKKELSNLFADGATRPLPEETLIAFLGNGHLTFGQATDIGMTRTNNQDAAYSFFTTLRSVDERPDFGIFIVADGMGGHIDGEKASAITVRTVAVELMNTIYVPLLSGKNENQPPITEALSEAIEKANKEVIRLVPDGGTTITTAVIIGDLAYIAHVGDSRIYLQTKDTLEQLTRDHSLVQRLIELDQLTPEEAADHPNKNMLYRALGQNEQLEIDTLTRRLPPRSRLLLCSDGLWNQVEKGELMDVVKQNSNPQDSCSKLIALANKRGGADNVTVIVLHMPG